MKILQVHNYYRSHIPSGENVVVDAEARLLREAGHAVETYRRSNDEVKTAPIGTALTAGLLLAHNPFAVANFRRALRLLQPDVVHVHNTFPLLSPALLVAAREHGAAVVMTVHNYRIFCAHGGLLRERRICTECLDRPTIFPAIRHGCYRNSTLATLPVAGMIALHRHRKTWENGPHVLIALTDFQRGVLQRGGIDAGHVMVKPHSADAVTPVAWDARDDYLVYVARLSEEKGIGTVIDAWHRLGASAPRLRIVGGGDLLEPIRTQVTEAGLQSRIELLGSLPHAQAMEELSRARALLCPSIWLEAFGMSVIEAYARGVPVIASRLGSLSDLVRDGVTGALVTPGDADSLATCVMNLWNDHGTLKRLANGAHAAWQEHYQHSSNLARLEAIYARALSLRA